jgi:hypothetical protein
LLWKRGEERKKMKNRDREHKGISFWFVGQNMAYNHVEDCL